MPSQLALTSEPVALTITVEGVVERVLHRNEETGWGVLLFEAEGSSSGPVVKAVGTFLGVRPGENLRLAGQWVEHPKFGRQFKVEAFTHLEPASLEGIKRYLASFIGGISTTLAKRIVEQFGVATLDVLAREPERLSEVKGLGKKRRKKILKAWQDTRAIRDVMVFLQGCGVSSTYAVRIYQRFAEKTIDVVRANPYRLTEVRGISFHRADAIAGARGIIGESLDRAAAGVIHTLEEAAAREGHMFLRRCELVPRAGRLLAVGDEVVSLAIEELCRKDRLRVADEASDQLIYLRRLEVAERTIAERLLALLAEKAPPLEVEVERAIHKFEAGERILLADAQRATLRAMVASKVMVLTGGPGTGKTTLTKGIVYVAHLVGLAVELAAPTGRAAKRLTEATGHKAKTIHRLLGYQGEVFTHHRDNPLELDLLVVDEASMLDASLARHLLLALSDSARLVIVGDVDQLPSVGPGRVLGDLIDSGVIPLVRLTEIFRQVQKSLIVVNAHRVIHGELPLPGADPEEADFFIAHRREPAAALAEVEGLVARRIPARFSFDPIRDIQILAPMRGGRLGVENLNLRLQELLNPGGEVAQWAGRRLRQGDRVMQRSNNYELEVFNGEIGKVAGFDSEEHRILIDFDGRIVKYSVGNLDELELAYAVTIHKAQGSEFPCVVIVLHTQHYVMLQRNLLYTAITRGRRLVIIVGAREALTLATKTETTQRRETLLVKRLQDPLR